jgi:hypothetical protein
MTIPHAVDALRAARSTQRQNDMPPLAVMAVIERRINAACANGRTEFDILGISDDGDTAAENDHIDSRIPSFSEDMIRRVDRAVQGYGYRPMPLKHGHYTFAPMSKEHPLFVHSRD